MTKFDVAIVGAGIAGASLAATLSTQSKLRILLLDMETQPGRHATGRSAASTQLVTPAKAGADDSAVVHCKKMSCH